jgi:hypothetical protein
LYYIFFEDLGHTLGVLDGLFSLDAARFDATVLVE